MEKISLAKAAELLKLNDNYEILTHRYPDGDALGSAFALCLALQTVGKNARVVVNGKINAKYAAFGSAIKEQSFTPDFIIAVDIAASGLLGELEGKYSGKIDLCLDHHGSNSLESRFSYVDSAAAANCEIIYELIKMLGAEVSKEISRALYLGISTDTGCFCYSNTTAETLRIAADLIDCGCENGEINHRIFSEKSKAKIELEKRVYENLRYYCGGKAALIYTTVAMQNELEIDDGDMEGLASIPRQIEGVLIGITLREKPDGSFKISVRTNGGVNACELCSIFGGGGHPAASGCSISGELEEVIQKIVKAAESFV